jgi:tetratricopeptide (TPR) repeat protein
MTPSKSSLWAVLAALLVLGTVPAAAQATGDEVQRYLNAAARLYENLDYERALEQLARAKRYGRGVDDDVLIALYEGVILADLGRKEDALSAFRTGLLLRPDAKLPVKVSPKVAKDFELVRGEVQRELAPLLAKQEAERKRREAEAEAQRQAEAARRRVVVVPPDRRGGGDRTRTVTAQPGEVPSDALPSAEVARQGPSRGPAPFVIGGASVVAAAAGAYFGVHAQTASRAALNPSQPYQDVADRYRQEAASSALIANALFGVAGVTAAGAVISWILSTPSEAAER